MRLPLKHPPPSGPPPLRTCSFLEALAEASVGVPLGAPGQLLSSARSRGRHGNALQWHLGRPVHDGEAVLDWEDRIEIKLVSVWRKRDGSVACDKLKVCDIHVDPWHKLSNVLWVFADRMTRVIVGYRFFHLRGHALENLAQSWVMDPHFEQPPLFVEARETKSGPRGAKESSAPAYYLSARWLHDVGILDNVVAPYEFDSKWWSEMRQRYGSQDPLLTIGHQIEAGDEMPCPRCHGTLHLEPKRSSVDGWRPARHGLPLDGICGARAHAVVDVTRLPQCLVCTFDEFCQLAEMRVPRAQLWRLSDRVAEPDDHLHEF